MAPMLLGVTMRETLLFRWVFVFLAWQMSVSVSYAQNLVPNHSFEDYDPCPTTYGNGGALQCAPWVNGNQATSDYFNACAVGTDVWVPANLMGSQDAHTGQAYVGCFMRETSIWREYVTAPLTSPCIAGFTYEVSFYVSLADLYCGVENIGAYLSVAQPPTIGIIGTIPGAIPQVEANLGFISETNEWVLVTGCFTAAGGEQWITIGNFYNNAQTPLEPGCNTSYASYYYIDDVSVVQGGQGSQLELELGDPVTTCSSYVIDPDVTGVDYLWSNGSTGPTLTVSESGTYALTITAGCGNIGVDSVEVTFIGSPPVNLGPPSLNLCEGETFGVNLDPAAGDYLWNDGSTNPSRIISTSGTYSVTLDDGCDITSDAITISVTGGPEPFTLGEDTGICSGDEIVFSFPPGLGNFLWQDGSLSPSYTITTSGLYGLTISNACGSVSDQIVVTEGTAPSIDLGAPVVEFCENETLLINYNFNASMGSFLWQDGSTSPDYSITSPGVYSVTVSNSCGVNSDQVVVELNELPQPVSLGDDVILCEGDQLSFSFDPLLGEFLWQDGSTQSSYTILTGGNYGLTISNSCGSVSDQLVVTGIDAPVADLGPEEMTLCDGETVMLELDPAAGEYVWQDGSTASSFMVTEPGLYAVTLTNACGSGSDMILVNEVQEPVVNLGDDMVICPVQLPLTLDLSNVSNANSFLWHDNSTSNQFVVTGAGVYAVTVSNACFAVSDEVEVSVESGSPVVVLPPDQIVCEGEKVILTANNVLGNYFWQDGSIGESFEVLQSGTYALTVTNQCGSGSDSITVTYIDTLDVLDLGPDVSLCPGESFVLHAGNAGAAHLWQDLSTGDSLTVSAAGTYVLQESNACNTRNDTVVVTMDGNPPVIDLPATMMLCDGAELSIDAGVAGVDYSWSNGAWTSSIMINSPGIYSVTISNSCGIATDAIEIVDGGDAPVVSLGSDLSLCPGESTTLSPSFANVESWLWQDGSTNASYDVTTAGEISVMVSNLCGTDTDTIIVAALASVPEFDLGSDTSLCDGEILTLTLSIPDVSITWSDGSIGNTAIVEQAGMMYATISNQCGANSDSIEINLLPGGPAIDLGNDQSLCPGEIITIEPGITDVEYLWQDGSTGNLFSTSNAGLVVLTVSNACGFDTDSLWIIENTEGPVVDLGDDVTACEGSIVTLQADVLGVDYLWQDGSTSDEFSTSIPGMYVLQVSNACGMDTDSIMVSFNGVKPNSSLGDDTVMCTGNILQLHANAGEGTLIEWQDGSTSPDFTVSNEGVYFIFLSNDCGVDSDTINVSYLLPPADIDLGPDTILCPGEFIFINAPATTDLITWQDGSHDSMMIADVDQTYSLAISNICGTSRDEVVVSIDERVPQINIEDLRLPCDGGELRIDVSQDFDADYLWSNESTEPLISVNMPGSYSFRITTECQVVEHEIEVLRQDCNEEVFIPNVFSPNGDHVNDEFRIFMETDQEPSVFTCNIYDRWGNQVYESHAPDFTWNGQFKGDKVSPGVYVYVITVEYQSSKDARRFSGDVTILR